MIKKIFFIAILFLSFGLFASVSEAASFNRDLALRSTGTDVLELQKCLNESPDTVVAQEGAGSIGNETDYFGALTKEAVIKYQNKYSAEILAPVGLKLGSGFVGPSTRAHLNKNCGNQVAAETEEVETATPLPVETRQELGAPIIDSISPTEGYGGEEITIKGKNFDAFNDISISFSSKDRIQKVRSSNGGTSITFTLDEDVTPKFQEEIDGLAQKLLDAMPGTKKCDKKAVKEDGKTKKDKDGKTIYEYVNCKLQKALKLGPAELARVNKVIDRFPDIPVNIYVTNKVGRSNDVEFKLLMESMSSYPHD